MTDSPAPLQSLATKICPWLKAPFEQLEAARRSGRLGHAWLIVAPAGSGSLNLALAFAARLLRGDESPLSPLDAREAVAAMANRYAPADHDPDLHWLHPEEDKRTISVEQVRDVIEAVSLTAHGGAAKVVVVEPADALTTAAANALLKTLEEPSANTYLLLLSHQPGRLPPTIRSRCQRLNVPRPGLATVAKWLEGVEEASVVEAWEMAGGSALGVADLVLGAGAAQGNELARELVELAAGRTDAQTIAQTWTRADPSVNLVWLAGQVERAIRGRFASEPGSTSITDSPSARLHNAWAKLTLETLFAQRDQIERLLGQLGSGINVDLALQALLVGFEPTKGRS